MNSRKKIVCIGSVWPEPNSSAAGQRMMQLLRLFKSKKWEIVFASSASKNKYAAYLEELGIQTTAIKINDTSFDAFIQNEQPEVVLFDRFIIEEQFGWRVAEQCPDALRILDTEDLHCLRRTRKKALHKNTVFKKEDLLKEDSAKREIASVLRCDVSLIISEYEMDVLRNLFKIDDMLLYYLPFLVDNISDNTAEKWPKFEDRAHFVMIGNFRHAPNWDAVQYLYESVWPLIHQQVPEAEVHIYGAYPSKRAKALHQPRKGFYIKGYTNDVQSAVQQARVVLAPLRFGAGLKGKLVEAMKCGTPSVTTAIGAEGIAGNMPWGGLIGQQPEDLAAGAKKLYSNRSAWFQAQQRGINIINERFADLQQGETFMNRIEEIRERLNHHRTENFTGAMLMHHTATSTKYMARWIEEKNRS